MMDSNGIEGMRKCVICISGFSSESSPTREQVKNMIDMIGACYMGPLCRNYTTHLVCQNCDRWSWREKVTCSDKCVAAREWGPTIRIVRVEWLMACIREWRFVDESEFGGSVVNEDEVETGDDEVEGDVAGVEGDVVGVEGDVAGVEGNAEEKGIDKDKDANEVEGNAKERTDVEEKGDENEMKEKDSDNNTNTEPKEANATELEGKQNNLEGNHTPSHKRPASPSLLPSKRPDAPTTPTTPDAPTTPTTPYTFPSLLNLGSSSSPARLPRKRPPSSNPCTAASSPRTSTPSLQPSALVASTPPPRTSSSPRPSEPRSSSALSPRDCGC